MVCIRYTILRLRDKIKGWIMLKTPQLMIMFFLAMLGAAMLIHGIVGLALLVAGIFSFVLYFRQKPDQDADAK